MKKHLTILPLVALPLIVFVLIAATDPKPERTDLLGGQATIVNTTPNAFGQPIPGLEREHELMFFVGNSFFNQNWVTAPASTTARDGLGPFFNARSCAGCHFKDGHGRAPEEVGEVSGLLIRLGMPGEDAHGAPLPEPVYGTQFQDNAVLGVEPKGTLKIEYEEVTGRYPDGTPYTLQKPIYILENLAYGELNKEVARSPRVANQMIGLGLLEAIPDEMLLDAADPDDKNKDGVSGRVNEVWDVQAERMSVGRFGWKAEQPSILQQAAAAFSADIGITTDVFPDEGCAVAQTECLDMQSGSETAGEPEIPEDDLRKLVLYSSTLAVPVQRNADDPQIIRGQTLFDQANCTTCHTPTQQTGEHPTIPALSNQTVHPFTDLLLHDMGEGLADDLSDFDATGREWRTPPLWGIGLFETVNGHTNYLHDGRARNLEEAVLWHGGEAQSSKEKFMALTKEEREALLAFLGSL